MKITLLGHASLLVEMQGTTCLMDPVFHDPFEEGAVTSCPRRTVYSERLPPIDVLIVSHRHPYHFDLSSLAAVPRDCDVPCFFSCLNAARSWWYISSHRRDCSSRPSPSLVPARSSTGAAGGRYCSFLRFLMLK